MYTEGEEEEVNEVFALSLKQAAYEESKISTPRTEQPTLASLFRQINKNEIGKKGRRRVILRWLITPPQKDLLSFVLMSFCVVILKQKQDDRNTHWKMNRKERFQVTRINCEPLLSKWGIVLLKRGTQKKKENVTRKAAAFGINLIIICRQGLVIHRLFGARSTHNSEYLAYAVLRSFALRNMKARVNLLRLSVPVNWRYII